MSTGEVAAEILEQSAAAFARQTCQRLEARLAARADELDLPSTDWHADALQRIADLIAALRLNSKELFVEKVRWLAVAYAARGVPVEVPKDAIYSLRETLEQDIPKQAVGTALAIVDEALAALEIPVKPVESSLHSSDELDSLALRYLALAMDGHTDDAIALVVESIGEKITPEEAVLRIALPAQREIGELWHQNEVTIAQEHLVTNATTELLAVISNKFAVKQDIYRKVIVTSVAGNPHDIGIRATGLLFRLAGWQTIVLGSDLPPNEIAGAADHFDVDVVVLCATIATHVDAVRHSITALRGSESQPVIIVGGLPFDTAPELWKEVGADAASGSISAAVTIARALTEPGDGG